MTAQKNFQPSDVAAYKAANVSDRYIIIDTEKLIIELQKRGFVLREIKQAKTGQGRHVVRMRTENFTEVGGEKLYPEIIIMNSYDKKCAFSVETGIFRLVCSNGLTVRVPGTEGDFYKCAHLGEPAKVAEEITVRFTENLEKVFGVHQMMVDKKLTDKQRVDLAMRAAEIRWNKKFTRAEAKKLLAAARPEDQGNDAWRVFNVLQEKVINGGVQLEGMKRVPRGVNRARANYKINLELFEAAYEIATVGKLSPRKLSEVPAEQLN